MANEVTLAIRYTIIKTFGNELPNDFVAENIDLRYISHKYMKVPLYYDDDSTVAGRVDINATKDNVITSILVYYRDPTYYGGKYDMYIKPTSTFAKEFGGRNIYFKYSDREIDIIQKPDWEYNIEAWNTYFKDAFDSNWDNVGKYLYEFKSKLPLELGKHTLRMDDNDMRWVILKDGMLLNLDNDTDTAKFDDTVRLRGIPIQYILLHMLPRLPSKFQSTVELIQKLRDRIGNNYTKSVLAMEDNGDLKKYTFTSCRVYRWTTELTISEVEKLVNHTDLWNGDSLKLLPAK